MRRTRLVAAAFAGTVCLATLAPVAVAAEPVAEVSPRRVHPGGTVTLTVTCGKHDEKVRYLTAYSQAFAEGEARLKLVHRGTGDSSGSGGYGKATYRGSAKIAPAHGSSSSAGSDTYGPERSYSSDGSYSSDDSADSYGADSYGSDEAHGSDDSDGSYSSDSYSADPYSSGSYGREPSGHGKSFGINGSCPDGSDFTTSVIVDRKPRGGAHAGLGGSHREMDTAAVAAGGALVSATVGFGVYVLRRRRSGV